MEIKKKIGQRVKEIRERKRLSVDDLAERTGIDRASLYRLEKGELNVTIVKLNRIAQALFVDLGDLVG